jgi:hypothetical protein
VRRAGAYFRHAAIRSLILEEHPMTGYTVHTGSTGKFTQGWDDVFGKGKSSGGSREGAPKTKASGTSAKAASGAKKAAKKAGAKKTAKGAKKSPKPKVGTAAKKSRGAKGKARKK